MTSELELAADSSSFSSETCIDREWLEYGLQQDAAYIAHLTLTGRHDAARDHIRATGYIDRMQTWKAGR